MNSESDRIENINQELVAVRKDFTLLVQETAGNNWDSKISGEVWSIKEELAHIVQALQVLPNGIKRAITGSSRSLLSFVPPGLRSWINGHLIVPHMAQKLTPDGLIKAYEQAHLELLLTLEKVSAED